MEGILGEIRAFAGNFAPVNWAMCDGRLLSISTYTALFALLGTTYGGNGTNNFALPDLRGRLAIGQGNGLNLTPRTIGNTGGSEEVTLTGAMMPTHNHSVIASTVTSGSIAYPSSATYIGSAYTSAGSAAAYMPSTATGLTQKTMKTSIIESMGSSLPHENIMPVLAINYIICITGGVYPSHD